MKCIVILKIYLRPNLINRVTSFTPILCCFVLSDFILNLFLYPLTLDVKIEFDSLSFLTGRLVVTKCMSSNILMEPTQLLSLESAFEKGTQKGIIMKLKNGQWFLGSSFLYYYSI